MFKVFTNLQPEAERFIRVGYLLLMIALAAYAAFIYQQLQALRARPVVLPNYAFYVVDQAEKASVILAIGTWIAASAMPTQQPLQTTTLECKRATMICVESTALVSVQEAAYLEAIPLIYAIDQWTDTELVTKVTPTTCTERVMRINFEQRKAVLSAAAQPAAKHCGEAIGNFTLENGAASLVRKPSGR